MNLDLFTRLTMYFIGVCSLVTLVYIVLDTKLDEIIKLLKDKKETKP